MDNPAINDALGGSFDILKYIPGASLAINMPQNFYQLIIAVIGLLPFVIGILTVVMILSGSIRWIRSSGNEKELEAAQVTIKRAIIGFFSTFVIFLLSNAVAIILTGFNLGQLYELLGPCGKYGFGLNYMQTQLEIKANTPDISDIRNTYNTSHTGLTEVQNVVDFCKTVK